jgi:hypothetical protein
MTTLVNVQDVAKNFPLTGGGNYLGRPWKTQAIRARIGA